MSDYSIDQALYIWSCLERAINKGALYGDDIVEVYVQHLLPKDYDTSVGKTLWKQAGKNLYNILISFCKENNAEAFVNGKELGNWLETYDLVHKCDVKVVRKT